MSPFRTFSAAWLARIACACTVVAGAASADTLTVTLAGSGTGLVTSDVGAINCGAVCSDTYTSGTAIVLTATADAGSQFTGWLGPCTGIGSCQFTIAGATTAVATFAAPPISGRTLDIDGNAECDALTDGLVVLRYLFGLTGAALVNNAVAPGAPRSEAQIAAYLANVKPALDIDGNGQADALTDGLMIIRYLFGLRGNSLIAGAIGSGALHDTPAAIATQVQNLAADPPLADAGSDQSVNVVDSVTLDGSASGGPPGVTLTYAWSFLSRPAGSAAILSGADTATPGFDPDEAGDYVLQLVVSAGVAVSAADTVTVNAASQVVRFIVTGAQGKGTVSQATVANAMDAKCDLSGCDYIVGLGNNIYDSGASSTSDIQFNDKFVIPYAGIDLPFWLGLGNHDYGGNGAGFDFPRALNEINYSAVNPKWKMPAHYYRRTDKHVEFFTLDTNGEWLSNPATAAQGTDVAGWLASSGAYWKIALGLHGYRSNGPHGNAGNYDGVSFGLAAGVRVRDFIEDRICGKAQVYFSAHDHSLQWLQQDAVNCPGTELIVSGTGADTTTLTGSNATLFESATLGFAYVVIRDRRMTVDFIGTGGTTLYTRTITR